MNTPLFLLGTTLVFWGWQTDLIYFSVIMAIVLEGERLIKSRLDLSPSDFNRVTDLCTIILLGMLIYLFSSLRSAEAILVLIQWLPFTFFPLLFTQVYSTSEKIDIAALFLIIRRRRAKKDHYRPILVNISYPYFSLCILSASAANTRTIWFYIGLLCLSSWALWFIRSKRIPVLLWVGLLALAGIFGYLGQNSLHQLQTLLEKKATAWFTSFITRDRDPYRARTAIGEMGELKLSDQILFRVSIPEAHKLPVLLHEASYNVYKSNVWFASRARFETVRPEKDGETWKISSNEGSEGPIVISSPMKRGRGMLKLPVGACKITGLPISKMTMNQFGAVKVKEGPGLVKYNVFFNDTTSIQSVPNETDLLLSEKKLPVISKVAALLELKEKSPKKILEDVSAFFAENFKYSLIQKREGPSTSPLDDFLLKTRSGHCEYFATATVLLLRHAGIPARYASGYSVQEYSNWEKKYIVRSRHAHAWTLVFVDGFWHSFDTTPSVWSNIEAETASVLEPFYDFWSWIMFQISVWRWSEGEVTVTKYVWWLIVPLIILLAKRLYSRKRLIRDKMGLKKAVEIKLHPGRDSDLFLFEKRLTEMGLERYPWETMTNWIERLKGNDTFAVSFESLQPVLDIHYRYRFDPEGITGEERQKLKLKVQSWLDDKQK